jgi:hypothetical protein
MDIDYSSNKRIQNNTHRAIVFPPSESFPKGIRLPPDSLLTVPALYLEEICTAEALGVPPPATRADKKPVARVRIPGKEFLESLLEPVRIDLGVGLGAKRGPQITIFSLDQCPDREDGPNHPDTLDDYKDVKVALKLVALCKDKLILEKWSVDRRDEIAQAARQRRRDLA